MARTHTTLTSLFSDIADEIRAKTGSTENIVADNFPTEIANIPTGGGEREPYGVYFLGYDGTEIDFWNASEVSSKTSLPENPMHTGLIAQGWNWTLQAIKEFIAYYPTSDVYVGQTYKTSSRLTEMDISLNEATGKVVTMKMSGNKNWGDGTTDSNTTHTYTDYGNYTITCDGSSIPAGSASAGGLFNNSNGYSSSFWCTEIRIGENVTSIGNYALQYCRFKNITIPNSVTSIGYSGFNQHYGLQTIILPNSITSISQQMFYRCYSLENVILPSTLTSISSSVFYQCSSLANCTIPKNVTSMETQAFAYCNNFHNISVPTELTSVDASVFAVCYPTRGTLIIPSKTTTIGAGAFQSCYLVDKVVFEGTITSIGNSAFADCYNVMIYDFSNATSIPTASNSMFNNLNMNCKIIVPDNLYNSWKVATNWTLYARYMYKASEVTED